MIVTAIGLALFLLGLLSRFCSLWLYRRVVATETRSITPSRLTRKPWLIATSDAVNLRRIVVATYVALIAGMVMLIVGVLLGV